MEVKIVDYDLNSDNDIVCHKIGLTMSRSLDEWASMQNYPIVLEDSSDDGSGFCTIRGVINAVNP